MKYCASIKLFSILFTFLCLNSAPIMAQEFFPLSDRLGLYCVYTPGDTLTAVYNKKRREVSYSDFATQIKRVNTIRKQTARRLNNLKRMKKDGTITVGEALSFKKIFKQIQQQRYRGDNDIRIGKFNQLIRNAKEMLAELDQLLTLIEDCRNRNLDLAAVSGLSIKTLVIEFYNPHRAQTNWMAGVAMVATLNRTAVRKGSATMCVGTDASVSEFQRSFGTNLCMPLFDFGAGGLIPHRYYFVCRPPTAGLPGNSGVSWLYWRLHSAPLDQSDLNAIERERQEFLERGYRARPYIKNRGGCI